MAAAPTKEALTNLYSTFMRTSKSFSSYNFRQYFVRQTQDRFRSINEETDATKVSAMYQEAVKDLAVLRRSAMVNQLYGGWKLVVEQPEEKSAEGEILRGDN
jgi:hypothetical protein